MRVTDDSAKLKDADQAAEGAKLSASEIVACQTTVHDAVILSMKLKIRINELARELEVKPNKILELLPELGVQEKKTHSSSIDEDVAMAIKRRFAAGIPVRMRTTTSTTGTNEAARLSRWKSRQPMKIVTSPESVQRAAPSTAATPEAEPPAAPPAAAHHEDGGCR